MQSKLTILYPAGFEEEVKVKQISSEEIQLPKSHGNKLLYTGVPPRVRGRVRKKQMYYAKFGYPFTFDPYSGAIFNDNKKRAILIERNIAYPMRFGNRNIAIILDYNFKDRPVPLWREEVKTKYEGISFKTIEDLQQWIENKENEGAIEDMEIAELPCYTEYDVSSIDMMRAENFQLMESGGIQTTLKAMEKIGDQVEMLWYFITFGGFLFATVLAFLFMADNGVFG